MYYVNAPALYMYGFSAYVLHCACAQCMPALSYPIVLNLVTVDLENWNGTDRHYFNAIVPDQDLVEVINNTSPVRWGN